MQNAKLNLTTELPTSSSIQDSRVSVTNSEMWIKSNSKDLTHNEENLTDQK